MVEFIDYTVIASIDAFIEDVETPVNKSDFTTAEDRRLKFKVSSAPLSERLQHYANGYPNLYFSTLVSRSGR